MIYFVYAFFIVIAIVALVTGYCYYDSQRYYRDVVVPELIAEEKERRRKEKEEDEKRTADLRRRMERGVELIKMGIQPDDFIVVGSKRKPLISEAEARAKGLIK